MFKFAWNILGLVGLLFILTLCSNPSLISGSIAITKSYWNQVQNNVQLAIEEWNRDE